MSYNLIKYFYEMGVYSVQEMIKYVKDKIITEEEFHIITGYNYQGIKKLG